RSVPLKTDGIRHHVGRVLSDPPRAGANRTRPTYKRSLLALSMFLCAGCRQDMHDQPKYIPLREATFFSDARSARPIVAGPVGRGYLEDDELVYTGKLNGAEAATFPFAIEARELARGQE